jgi:lysophospholipase L1-like esterase
VKNEDSSSVIPTIVNGITSVTTSLETGQETSIVPSDVNGAMNYSAITNLRESINAHQNKKHSSKKHRIILIGDSNMRGYASSLKPFLNSNYNLYSVVKSGSNTNELEKTANKAISHLTHDDMIILCYGTNDFNQKNSKNPELKFSSTFQNIKNFIMNNNHTNILLMNIPFHYDRPNASYVNKIILRLNRKLQKLVKVNTHTKFLETCNDRNLFTNHGLHRNKQGKNLVKLQLASVLYTTFDPRSSKPIPLEWYETCIENNDNEDIKKFITSNRNSCLNRKTPVTRTNDFLWLS